MVVLLYKPNANPDEHVVGVLESSLRKQGYDLFIDRRSELSINRAQVMDDWIRRAENVVLVVSKSAAESESLDYELDSVAAARRQGGKPRLVTVRVGVDTEIPGPIGSYVVDDRTVTWCEPTDDQRTADGVIAALKSPEPAEAEALKEPVAAIRPSNRFYTLRKTDDEFDRALVERESVILVRGPRQVGKTTLIGRGAELAHELGWAQVSTDFQKLNAFQLADVDKFCLLLARSLARQIGFSYDFGTEWVEDFGPNLNLDHFIKSMLSHVNRPVVWFMDEADRIFSTNFASDFYGLVRTWHNARATDPRGPWSKLTVVIGYATEARLFIRDLNQSPFNVGRQLRLENFTVEQTADLNEKFGNPVKRQSDLQGMQFLLGGQPFLTRRALEIISSGAMTFGSFIDSADRDDGPFADHLRRVLYAVSHAPQVVSALRSSLAMLPMSDTDSAHRLIAAGVLREGADGVSLACDLYAQYLAKHLV